MALVPAAVAMVAMAVAVCSVAGFDVGDGANWCAIGDDAMLHVIIMVLLKMMMAKAIVTMMETATAGLVAVVLSCCSAATTDTTLATTIAGLFILVQDDDAVCNHPRLFRWWRVCLHSEGRKASRA